MGDLTVVDTDKQDGIGSEQMYQTESQYQFFSVSIPRNFFKFYWLNSKCLQMKFLQKLHKKGLL